MKTGSCSQRGSDFVCFIVPDDLGKLTAVFGGLPVGTANLAVQLATLPILSDRQPWAFHTVQVGQFSKCFPSC